MADLIISQPMTFTVDVRNGLVERPQRESLMRGDKMANRIIAELKCGSEPFDITGVTVKGVFCRPPNGDEIELYGEAERNVARVQLTDQCYTSGGHYEARVILEFNGVERTVLFISGDVLKSGSGNAAGDEETGGSGGSTGSGLPTGGTAGQVLVKVSSAQGDAIWKSLTAADVGARPDNWMPTAEETGALPKDGTAADANKLNGKDADQYLTVDKVVNNFTTTEAGFVADARALKVLDEKTIPSGLHNFNDAIMALDGVSAAQSCFYRKIGRLCIVAIEVQTSKEMAWDAAGSAATVDGVVPRPGMFVTGVLCSGETGVAGKFVISGTGQIIFRTPASGSSFLAGQCVYIINE